MNDPSNSMMHRGISQTNVISEVHDQAMISVDSGEDHL
jgi:hypothetical protein